MSPDELVALARIIKPRGNKGEVAAQDLCEEFERFTARAEFAMRRPDGEIGTAVIERAWVHNGRLILKLAGVESITDAERLRGCEICIPYGELGEPKEGEHYYVDLIGCEVTEAETGRALGRVEAIQEPGGPILLEVHRDGREILIPFVEQICVRVDVKAKKIEARLPEGLEELND